MVRDGGIITKICRILLQIFVVNSESETENVSFFKCFISQLCCLVLRCWYDGVVGPLMFCSCTIKRYTLFIISLLLI